MLQTDYSNLFAAGLRVIEDRSSSHQGSSVSSSDTLDHQDLTALNRTKTFHFPTRLWSRSSPRNETGPATDPSPNATDSVVPRPTRRRSMSGGVVEETALDVRIWDWSTRVYQATSLLEEDECVDPYLHKIDSASPSNRKAILLTLPNSPSLEEHDIPATQAFTSRSRHRDRRVSVQTVPVHMMLPTHPFRSSLDKGAFWEAESTSDSSSLLSLSDGQSMDDDWRQFRVEWIDFDGP